MSDTDTRDNFTVTAADYNSHSQYDAKKQQQKTNKQINRYTQTTHIHRHDEKVKEYILIGVKIKQHL